MPFKCSDEVMKAKSWGQYFTRRDVIDIIVGEIKPKYNECGSDETCGTGGFLLGFEKYVHKKLQTKLEKGTINKKEYKQMLSTFKSQIYGHELIWKVYKPLMLNLQCHDIKITDESGLSRVKFGSCLSKTNLHKSNVYDFMAGNPPFGLSIKWETWMNGKLPIQVKNSVAVIIQLYIYKLKVGGRCGLVIDRGILNNGSGEKSWESKMRKLLLESNNLYKIILLPTGIFAHTNFATAIIFFTKGGSSTQVEFIEGYFKDEDKGKSNKGLFFKESVVISIKKIKKNNYSLKLDDYYEQENESKYEMIKIGDIISYVKYQSQKANVSNDTGKYPYYSSSIISSSFSDVYTNNDECLIINKVNGSGKTKIYYNNGKFSASSAVIIFKPSNDEYDIKYIWYYLQLNKKILESKYSGGDKKSLNNSSFEEIKIPVATIKHQRKIVTLFNELCEVYDMDSIIKYLSDKNIFDFLIEKKYDEFRSIVEYQHQLNMLIANLEVIQTKNACYASQLKTPIETMNKLISGM